MPFKALARALRYASERDPRAAGILPSTKGACERLVDPADRRRPLSSPSSVCSFVKQKMPKSLIVLLSIAAGMCLVAGVMRAGGVSRPSPSKKVVVFDYGFGNVRSAERALARARARSRSRATTTRP
ncbi:hypothetical protein SGRIM119S_08477 [Streptomyces griseorubiginosus]